MTLSVYDRTPIKQWLQEADIMPMPANSRRYYPIAQLHEAIERHTGKRIFLDCKRLPRKISPVPILTGVHVCLQPTTLQLTDCGSRDDIDCGTGSLMFLTSG